ncbi:hypothetical protein [Natrinema sp. 1APR25-10V2]|uniref:hypothetical protein n=1 Tax=Natrinema sp. 1APR25-10V2 TaxID=2951081 RepID=UPI0028770679|nr:hypothetical protein [Natrinema sp. 1APR25-10V2]MDS0474208.1 hypothetical protein [Natrinema sp. 1APR25-10V2]
MSGDDGPNGDGESRLPDCPRCGERVVISVAFSPEAGLVSPCGCSVPPALFPEVYGD